jgi:hypothetical protein
MVSGPWPRVPSVLGDLDLALGDLDHLVGEGLLPYRPFRAISGPATAVAATRPTSIGMTNRPAVKADLCCTVCRNNGTYSIATNSTIVAIRNCSDARLKMPLRNRCSGVIGAAFDDEVGDERDRAERDEPENQRGAPGVPVAAPAGEQQDRAGEDRHEQAAQHVDASGSSRSAASTTSRWPRSRMPPTCR